MTWPILILLLSSVALAEAPAYGQLVFGTPRNLGSPINTPGIEVGPNLSADGLTLYFVSDRPGGHSGSPELWMSARTTTQGLWASPVNLGPGLNSHAAASPSISTDGLELYFDSDELRPGGQGDGDIWIAMRRSTSAAWGTPQNLGPGVNSPFADGVPKLSRDGLSLFFASNRPGGSGDRDVWVTNRAAQSEPWGAPVNLGPVVNGPGSDWCPAVSTDGLTLIFQSDRPGGLGADDFWVTIRVSLSAAWNAPIHLGSGINSAADEGKAEFSVDGRTILFMSTRPGGIGSLDIWEIPILAR
jgi:Tol biopolymer transport system component